MIQNPEIIEEAEAALRTGSCFIAPGAARDLIERMVTELKLSGDKIENISGESLERFYELEKQQWIPVSEREPDKSGDYLCAMMDARDDCSDEWMEILDYTKSQAFNSGFNTVNFDEVTHWQPIEPPQ